MKKLLVVVPLCMFLLVLFVEAAPQGSLITQLPGFSGKFLSNHYSGYVTHYILISYIMKKILNQIYFNFDGINYFQIYKY